MVSGLAIGVPDHVRPDRFVAALTPDFGVLFGPDVVAGALLAVLFALFVSGVKLFLGP